MRVLDLFAGSGALGIEALSRGAAYCLFVDTATEARATIRANLDRLGLTGAARVSRRNATRLGPRSGPAFDLVFLDPPYREALGGEALRSVRDGNWLRPGGIAVLEEADQARTPAISDLIPVDERRYGTTAVRLFRLERPFA